MKNLYIVYMIHDAKSSVGFECTSCTCLRSTASVAALLYFISNDFQSVIFFGKMNVYWQVHSVFRYMKWSLLWHVELFILTFAFSYPGLSILKKVAPDLVYVAYIFNLGDIHETDCSIQA